MKDQIEAKCADIIERLLVSGVRPNPSFLLPPNVRIVFDAKAALITQFPQDEQQYNQLISGSPEMSIRSSIHGPMADTSLPEHMEHFQVISQLTSNYREELKQNLNWSTDEAFRKFPRTYVSPALAAAVAKGQFPAVVEVAKQDLTLIMQSRLLGHTLHQEFLDLALEILLAGGIRVGWMGKLFEYGDPVVFWPWTDCEPVIAGGGK